MSTVKALLHLQAIGRVKQLLLVPHSLILI
jgi:hypothetical protein